jgi:hypothetical protein
MKKLITVILITMILNFTQITASTQELTMCVERRAVVSEAYREWFIAQNPSIPLSELERRGWNGKYYGTLNGYEVVQLANSNIGATIVIEIWVEDYYIDLMSSSASDIYVFTGDTFVQINEAYRQGLLRIEDIRKIGTHIHADNPHTSVTIAIIPALLTGLVAVLLRKRQQSP